MADRLGQSPRAAGHGITRGFAQRLVATLLCLSIFSAVDPAAAQPFRIIDRFAGGSNGDGGPATGATLNPIGVAVDAAGNIYIADSSSHRIRRVDAVTGFISTVAGTGSAGFSGDGGPAEEADLSAPIDVAIDVDGNIFISDRGNERIRRIDAFSGIIDTVAGNGNAGFGGDNGPATAARLDGPGGIAIHPGTNLGSTSDDSIYIADTSNQRIRRFFEGGGIQTVAGNGEFGFSGDGGPATNGSLALPADVTVAANGDVYIADFANQRIRVISDGTIFTAAGSGTFAFCDNQPPEEACFRNPIAVEYDPVTDAVLVADAANQRIRSIPTNGGNVTTVIGSGTLGYNGDNIDPLDAWLNGPSGIGVHPTIGIFISDQFNHRIRFVPHGANPKIQTVAGNGNIPFAGDGGPALSAKFNAPAGTATDSAGNLYIADTGNNRIRKVDTNGTITTIAGTGDAGFSGDTGLAVNARLDSPADIAVDDQGNVYISDTKNNRVRRIDTSGFINTVLGNGVPQSSGDGGPARSASTAQPDALAVYENSSGTQRFLYVVESAANKVRAVRLTNSLLTNTVNRFAGTGNFGSSGDGGPASSAQLAVPQDICADDGGNVYIADTANHRIRKVNANGIISTIAGTGSFGYDGDGGLAISARLAAPNGVAAGPLGNIFILDPGNQRVRVVDTTGTIQTAMGTGTQTGRIDGEGGNPLDDLGDGGPATSASFSSLASISMDDLGNAYVCDNQAETVRWVEDISSLYDSGTPQASLFGEIRYASSLIPVPSATVEAFGTSTESTSSAGSGSFSFTAIDAAPWLVQPSKQGGFANGVISPLDASYVLQELVGLRRLTNAQVLACDVTGDGNLSALDATRILQRALGSSTPFAAAESCDSDWIFIPNAQGAQNQTQIDPLLEGGSTCRPGAIQYNPLTGEIDGQNFTAVVIGDCTGNWTSAGAATSASLRVGGAGGDHTVTVGPERRSRRRLRVPISVRGGDGFNALEVRLGYDAAALAPLRVRSRGKARDALVSWRESEAGEMTVMLASGNRIPSPSRNVLVVDFEIVGEVSRRALRSARTLVDEENARVRVSSGRRRRR